VQALHRFLQDYAARLEWSGEEAGRERAAAVRAMIARLREALLPDEQHTARLAPGEYPSWAREEPSAADGNGEQPDGPGA